MLFHVDGNSFDCESWSIISWSTFCCLFVAWLFYFHLCFIYFVLLGVFFVSWMALNFRLGKVLVDTIFCISKHSLDHFARDHVDNFAKNFSFEGIGFWTKALGLYYSRTGNCKQSITDSSGTFSYCLLLCFVSCAYLLFKNAIWFFIDYSSLQRNLFALIYPDFMFRCLGSLSPTIEFICGWYCEVSRILIQDDLESKIETDTSLINIM